MTEIADQQNAEKAQVHGIDRKTQRHLCGVRPGIGTDAIQPSMPITCPGCVERLGDYR